MIYRIDEHDASTVAKLAQWMWTETTPKDLTEEFKEIIGKKDSAVFLLSLEGQAVGFAQCQLRHDYVEGTDTSPVGYLEGIFVLPAYRKQGHARELLARCEAWAKEQGCSEFASDCELDNEVSLAFHKKMGFVEANRIICFTKALS